MKSKKTILLLSALAALCLLSCNNDHDPANVNPVPVRFTAAIGTPPSVTATPTTRATGTAWAAGDSIGIFMLEHATVTTLGETFGYRYTTPAADGRFTPDTGTPEIYYPMAADAPAADFVAFYPYLDLAANWPDLGPTNDFAYVAKYHGTQTAATQAATDLLWAKADNNGTGYRKSTPGAQAVSLTFRHALAKLTMHCTVDASVGANILPDDITATIRGMNTAAMIELKSQLMAKPSSPADIIPRRHPAAPAGFLTAYDAIIPPDTYAAGVVTVDFTIRGETFTWHVAPVTFDSGKNYLYEVLITRTRVSATATIEDWNTQKMGPVETE